MKEEDAAVLNAEEMMPPKAYEQWDGEPDKWYARFMQFCELGPSRSLVQCYRTVMAAQDALAGEDGVDVVPERRSAPEGWRRKAKTYDWLGRAATWDREQRQLAVQYVDETLIQVSMDSQEVRQFYINLMRGLIKMPDGEMVVVRDIYQRRMAAKSLQNWSTTARAMLRESQDLKRGRIKVTEMEMNGPWDVPDVEEDI